MEVSLFPRDEGSFNAVRVLRTGIPDCQDWPRLSWVKEKKEEQQLREDERVEQLHIREQTQVCPRVFLFIFILAKCGCIHRCIKDN